MSDMLVGVLAVAVFAACIWFVWRWEGRGYVRLYLSGDDRRLLRRQRGLHPLRGEALAMSNFALILVSGALIVYLFVAMLWPERF
jgi:K+-transporting ATPase KdpF subunit